MLSSCRCRFWTSCNCSPSLFSALGFRANALSSLLLTEADCLSLSRSSCYTPAPCSARLRRQQRVGGRARCSRALPLLPRRRRWWSSRSPLLSRPCSPPPSLPLLLLLLLQTRSRERPPRPRAHRPRPRTRARTRPTARAPRPIPSSRGRRRGRARPLSGTCEGQARWGSGTGSRTTRRSGCR